MDCPMGWLQPWCSIGSNQSPEDVRSLYGTCDAEFQNLTQPDSWICELYLRFGPGQADKWPTMSSSDSQSDDSELSKSGRVGNATILPAPCWWRFCFMKEAHRSYNEGLSLSCGFPDPKSALWSSARLNEAQLDWLDQGSQVWQDQFPVCGVRWSYSSPQGWRLTLQSWGFGHWCYSPTSLGSTSYPDGTAHPRRWLHSFTPQTRDGTCWVAKEILGSAG